MLTASRLLDRNSSLDTNLHLSSTRAASTLLDSAQGTLRDPLQQMGSWSGSSASALAVNAASLGTTLLPPNETRTTADNWGTLSGWNRRTGNVGAGSGTSRDVNDYYQFNLSTQSNFSLVMSGLSADVDIEIQNAVGTVLAYSRNGVSSDRIGSIASEAINLTLNAGTYYARVYHFNGAASDYTIDTTVRATTSTADWYSRNLSDAGLINWGRTLAGSDGQLSRTDMIMMFRTASDNGSVDSTELRDLRTIVNNASMFRMEDHVRQLSGKIFSDAANTNSGVGNLAAGTAAGRLESLVGKWFLGTDHPNAGTGATYQRASGQLFRTQSTAAGDRYTSTTAIDFRDINQGGTADCYFLAGLSTAARSSPNSIQNMFIENKDVYGNPDGTYTVRFFINGQADYVTVDRMLPTSANRLTQASRDYSGGIASNTNELWVALAEKAYAQINESGRLQRGGNDGRNTYDAIGWGNAALAISHITGRNTSWQNLDFNSMVNDFNAGRMVTLGSHGSDTLQKKKITSGIVGGHVYVLTGYNATTRQFQLYNPWGIGNGTDNGFVNLSWNQITEAFASRTHTA